MSCLAATFHSRTENVSLYSGILSMASVVVSDNTFIHLLQSASHMISLWCVILMTNVVLIKLFLPSVLKKQCDQTMCSPKPAVPDVRETEVGESKVQVLPGFAFTISSIAHIYICVHTHICYVCTYNTHICACSMHTYTTHICFMYVTHTHI